jgi:hypothetical protein
MLRADVEASVRRTERGISDPNGWAPGSSPRGTVLIQGAMT